MRGLRVLCLCGAIISLLACSEKIYKSVPAPQAAPTEDPQAYYSNSPTLANLNERYKYLEIIHDLYTPTTPSFMKFPRISRHILPDRDVQKSWGNLWQKGRYASILRNSRNKPFG